MTRTVLLCLLLALLSGHVSRGQINRYDSIRIAGVIMDKDSVLNLPFALYQVNEKERYTSDQEGSFSLWAREGDVIHFSYVGFKDLYVKVHDSLAYNNFLFGVFLSRDTIELSEVVIVPRVHNIAAVARNMPLKNAQDQLNANYNIRMSTYQALSRRPQKMDAEYNQKMVIRRQMLAVEYQAMVSPEHIVGVDLVQVGPQVVELFSDKYKDSKPDLSDVTPFEKDFLSNLLKEKRKQRSDNQ